MRFAFFYILMSSILLFGCSGISQDGQSSNRIIRHRDEPFFYDFKIIQTKPVVFNSPKKMKFKAALILYFINNTSDSIVPINPFDPKFDPMLCKMDTVFPDGWKVEYLVKNDSTKYTDLYIRCSRQEKSYVFFCDDYPSFRPCFIPMLFGQNEKFIYFSTFCITAQRVLLVMNKLHPEKSMELTPVIDFDVITNRLVLPSHENDGTFFSIYDLSTQQTKEIIFRNRCNDPTRFADNCIDSVKFSENFVSVFCSSGENQTVWF